MRRTCLFALLLALPGCPASTTLETDGGSGIDAFSSVDSGGGTDGPPIADAGPPHGGWDACTATADCTLVPNGCCAPCGTANASELDAVNTSQISAHFTEVCPAPTPCPACVGMNNPELVPVCEAMHCTVVDVSTMPLAACTADTDCMVRYANCCGCGGTEDRIVAVRTDAEAAIEQLLCDGGGCALDCIAQPVPGFVAVCDATTHHCNAVRPMR